MRMMRLDKFFKTVAEKEDDEEGKMKVMRKGSDSLIHNLAVNIMDDSKIQIIHLAAHPNKFVLRPNKALAFKYDILYKDEENSIIRRPDEKYSFRVFKEWDEKFLNLCFGDDRPSNVSLEMHLMNYISKNIDDCDDSQSWLERFTHDRDMRQHLKETDDMLYFTIKRTWHNISENPLYHKFEKRLVKAVRILAHLGPDEQYEELKSMKKLRKFIDVIKTRSHLPTIFGMYILESMRTVDYSNRTIKELINRPNEALTHLEQMLIYYWMLMLLPYNGE